MNDNIYMNPLYERIIIMWSTKYFKSHAKLIEWVGKNQHKNQITIIYVNNGHAVEYRPLRKVY